MASYRPLPHKSQFSSAAVLGQGPRQPLAFYFSRIYLEM